MKIISCVIGAIIFLSACNPREYYRVSYVRYFPNRCELYLDDERAFSASVTNNPYYKNIDPNKIKSAKYVYFSNNAMYIKDSSPKDAGNEYVSGSDKHGNLLVDGDIRLKVQELNRSAF